MFTEIENELLHIISEDPMEKIAFPPTVEVAKMCQLIFKINVEDIERVYINERNDVFDIGTITVIVKGDEDTFFNTTVMNGKIYTLAILYNGRLNKSETNAEKLCEVIANYCGIRLSILLSKFQTPYGSNINSLLMLALPILVCSIIRRLYEGELLPKIISKSIQEFGSISEECISSIFKLLDEGLTVNDLLDNSAIIAIEPDDKNYPGIWPSKKDK